MFAVLEIGRLLWRETASVRVERGAACISACLFVLMGAMERYVAAVSGLHRPSFREPRRETLVPAMAEQLGQYAEEMGVSRRIVDDMLVIPASRVRFVTAAQLALYGLSVSVVR